MSLCHNCEYIATSKASLENHIKCRHIIERPFEYKMCDYNAKKHVLEKHVNDVYEGAEGPHEKFHFSDQKM